MGLFADGRPVVAAVVVAGFLAGLAACGDGGDGTALPSTRPSVERTFTRTADAPTTTATRTAETPTATATATRTAGTPTRTGDPETTTPAEPSKPPTGGAPTTTTPAAPTTNPPTATTPTATTTPPATSSPAASPSAVAATTTSGISGLGWLLILLMVVLAILVAVFLVNRSRRTAAWESEAMAMAAGGRSLIATRLPVVLSAREPADRAFSWPPVRADLTEASTRWTLLASRATDDYHRDLAAQIGIMLQDLVTAVDAENQALATGGDWRQLSLRVDEIVRTLDAALTTFVAPAPDPGGGAEPYPA